MDRKRVDIELVLENGLALRTLGWMLLIFDGVFVNWVWTGLRAGSMFWVVWVLLQGFIGMVLVGAGMYQRSRSAQLLLAVPTDLPEPAVLHAPEEITTTPRAA